MSNQVGEFMDLSRRVFVYKGVGALSLISLNWSFAAGLNGSGIPGSPEMLAFESAWRELNSSSAKQTGRDKFSENKYGMFIHWGLYSQWRCLERKAYGGWWRGSSSCRVDYASKND